ncbi:MAG: hypothetical protein K6E87_04920 [bacterium]|nr:hypothetical protein [bacterium]
MLKYRYLYKEYILRILLLSFVLLALMFLQFGFKKRSESLNDSFIVMIPDIFTSVEFIIGVFLFDNFKKSKMELVRTKHLFLSFFERLFITIIMVIIIRLLASTLYSLIVYQSFNNYEFILRIMYVDICNVLIAYICFNVLKNRYVALIISLIISIALYIPKWLQYDIIRISENNFINVSFIPFIGIIIYFILFIISILWRNEYVRD